VHTIINECDSHSRLSIHVVDSVDLCGNINRFTMFSVVARKRNGRSHSLIALMLVARSAWDLDSSGGGSFLF
jgi:hypothetical protein